MSGEEVPVPAVDGKEKVLTRAEAAARDKAKDAAMVAEIAGSLEIFFQLGLPDTKTAKWVQARGQGIGPAFQDPNGQGGGTQGNAWLLREEADGTVELVVNQARVIKAKKRSAKGAKDRNAGGLPGMEIKPVDFAADLEAMTQGWKRTLQMLSNSRSNDEEGDLSEMGSRYGQDFRGIAAEALLLAAHLQRQGKVEQVREILPMALKLGGTAEGSLNAAISTMADGRLAKLTEAWAKQGDANAYAAGIDKLAAEFSRGWANREAAQMLAGRLRQQSPAENAGESLAKAAAELLLGLRAEQFAELPVNHNWLLAGADSTQRPGMGGRWNRYAPPDEEEDEESEAEEKNQAKKPEGVKSPVKLFFAKPREAVKALSLLLGDGRFLRTTGPIQSDRHSYSYSSDETPEQALQRKYGKMARPPELGEVAEALLTGLLPERMTNRYDGEGLSAEAVRAWVEEIGNLSDEELAWNYLRKSGQSSNSEFDLALNYLVEKGSAATLVKLQEVFQDPAVWRGNFDGVLVHLEGYMKKAPGDKAAFGEKLQAAAKTALEEERAERGRYQTGMSADYVKRQEAQEMAQLKKVEQFFKQTGLAEALGEILAAGEAEAQALTMGLQPILARTPPAEVEAQLLQATVQAKTYAAKSALLSMAQSRGRQRGNLKKLEAMDEATKTASRTLLQNEEKGTRPGGAAVADMAAGAILFSRFTPEDQAGWTQLHQNAPQMVTVWMRSAALGVAEGKPLAPAPSAARVTDAETTALVAELAALPADKLPVAAGGKTPDQQLGLLTHLEKPDVAWPPSFKAAYFKVREVEGEIDSDLGKALGAAKWSGRAVDDAFVAEVTAAVDKVALEGKGTLVMLYPKGLLGGFTMTVSKNPQSITLEQFASYPLKLPADKPAPLAFSSYSMQGGTTERQMGGLGFYYPLWKDDATNKAWKETHRKAMEAEVKNPDKEVDPGHNQRNDPAAMEKTVKAVLEQQPGARKPFQIRWYSAQIVEKQEKAATPDDDADEDE